MSEAELRLACQRARQASAILAAQPYSVRQSILQHLSICLRSPSHQSSILIANESDCQQAKQTQKYSEQLMARLKITSAKLETLATGLTQLSDPSLISDPLNRVQHETLVSNNMRLTQITVPIGVIMVIFESRPDGTAFHWCECIWFLSITLCLTLCLSLSLFCPSIVWQYCHNW